METDRLGPGEAPGQRTELREGRRRPVLVVEAHGGGRQRLRIIGGEPGRRPELPLGRDRSQRLLVARSPQKMRLDRARRAFEARDEGWEAGSGGRKAQIL